MKRELHLVGNVNAAFYEKYLKGCANIFVHAPLLKKNYINRWLNMILAWPLEPAKDRNNELAISNKILAYLQSGLYVMATNTPAQKDLFKKFSEAHGICFDYTENNFEEVLNDILKQKELIRSRTRFQGFKILRTETGARKQ